MFTPNRSHKFNDKYVSRRFKKACRESGFKDIHLHSLRHSFRYMITQKNLPISSVMQMEGHSNITVTQKYMHVRKESLFSAIRTLDN